MFDEMNEDPRLDLTSLIDVIFMLVIFFVMTMTFASPVLDVTLPKAGHSQKENARTSFELTVREDGSFWDGRNEIARSDLEEWMNRDPEETLILRVDSKAPFESFVKAVDAAKFVRSGRFAIATDKISP